MPELNVPLLRKTMEHIDDLPDYTEALRALALGEGEPDPRPDYWWQGTWKTHLARAGFSTVQVEQCGTAACFAGWAAILDGEAERNPWESIADQARRVLGLTFSQADRLFAAYNSREDLHRLVEEFTADAEAAG